MMMITKIPLSDPTRLNLAATQERTQAEGPGWRYALWVQGCPLRCSGCCNPHLLEFRAAQTWGVTALADAIRATPDIEGVSVLGGEPFAQAAALAALARTLRQDGYTILVFTGYQLAALQQAPRDDWHQLLQATDVLIDGPYDRMQPDTTRRWIGSRNQVIHFLSDRYAPLRPDRDGWPRGGNTLELRLVKGVLTINGFPHETVTDLARRPPPSR